MKDQCNRNINYMRISITDRCNLRCRYCMPAEGIEKVSMSQILTYEEILRICREAVSLGITRFKVTGGEPLVRKGCVDLCREMKGIPGIEQVTLTTNGQRLADLAPSLREAGLDGVNVSLDSLRADRYRDITGGGDLESTLEGIRAALDCGLKTKVNCLLQKGFNEDELADFASIALGLPELREEGEERMEAGDWPGENRIGGRPPAALRDTADRPATDFRSADRAADRDDKGAWQDLMGRGLDVRFIEIMPIGFGLPETGLSNLEVLDRLRRIYPDLTEDVRRHGNGPAVYYRRRSGKFWQEKIGSCMSESSMTKPGLDEKTDRSLTGGAAAGAIGLISAMHASFCGSCNRIRLTSQGLIKPCLCYEDGTDLRPALAAGDAALKRALREAILAKPVGHTFEEPGSATRQPMMAIGG